MRAASRALALDPGAEGAAGIVTHLLLEPPREPSPEVRQALRRTDADGVSRHARAAVPGYLLIAAFLPIIVWNGVRSWSIVLSATALALGLATAAWRLVRIPDRPYPWMVIYTCGNALLLAVLSRLIGSITGVAALVTFITASVITYPVFLHRRWLVIAIMVAGFLLPIGLEAIGAIPPTWALVEGGLLIRGHAIEADGPPAVVSIVLASVATVIMAGLQSVKLARANRDAQHRLVFHAWHLRQLLPAASIRTPPAPAPRPPGSAPVPAH
jgi:hypothetical protein